MNREGKKCLLYSRVSTEMQVDGYSLEAQKNCLKRFAEREEMVVAEAYEDAGKSGVLLLSECLPISKTAKTWITFSYISFLVLEEMRRIY